MKRKALGKGLSSLIPTAPVKAPSRTTPEKAEEGLREIDLDLIEPNRHQPREDFDEETLGSLAQSMLSQGVLQPIVVRAIAEDRFEIVAGERRWRAAQIAGLLKVPAIIKKVPDERLLEYALIENLQREQLNPIEESQSYQKLISDFGLTQTECAERVGKPRTTIANALRLLTLPMTVQRRLKRGEISVGHAKVLLSLERAGRQAELADRVVKDQLSVRQLEQIIAREQTQQVRTRAKGRSRDPNIVAAEEKLQRALGTKVRIIPSKKGGRIEVHCFSQEELDATYSLMLGAGKTR